MKRINIAGTAILTGTALADALLRYWITVARLHRHELAEIPFIDDDGERQVAQVVLCSTVPMWTSTVDSDSESAELTDASALADLEARNTALDPHWDPAGLGFDEG